MSTRKIIGVGSGFLVLFTILTIYLARDDRPRNENGYIYQDHFVHAGISSPAGILDFNVTKIDTIRIYEQNGDTLVIDWPDKPDERIYMPGLVQGLYYEFPSKVIAGRMTFFNMQSEQFYSAYSFPDSSWEVWPGTTPGQGVSFQQTQVIPVASAMPLDSTVFVDATYDAFGNPYHYLWNFGGPDSCFNLAITHKYHLAGNYLVCFYRDEATARRTGCVRMLWAGWNDTIPSPPAPINIFSSP